MKIKIVSLLLAVLLPFSSFFTAFAANEDTGIAVVPQNAELSDAFKEVLKNEKYTLYYNSKTAETAVENNESGYIWYSNPIDRDSDTMADSQEKLNLYSQVVLYYYSGETLSPVDSYSFGTKLNQITAETKGDTFKVIYNLGEQKFSINQLPQVISRTRMEKDILPELSKEDRSTLLKRYSLYSKADMDKESYEVVYLNFPAIADHDIYVRAQIPDYIGKEIWAILEKAGYTLEDLQRDCDENSMENTYKPSPSFKLELEYKLNDDGFSVECDPEKIEYGEDYKPIRMELLPFFGAAGTNESGYMLVPDGSGAVISFNNGKLKSQEYWRSLFGDDSAIQKDEANPSRQELTLPVFALSNTDGGYLATIDSGYENAGIAADVSGKSNSYNNIYSYYTLFSSDTVNISANNSDSNLFIVSSDEIFSGKIKLSYHLTDGYTSYSDFAGVYRDYLIANKLLPKSKEKASAINIELIGTVEVKKKFLGFPYNTLASATSYTDAEKILDELGIADADITFLNALSGGKQQKSAEKLKAASVLGSKKELNILKKKAGNVAFSYYALRQDKASKSKSAKSISEEIVRIYDYNLISRLREKNSIVQLSSSVLKKNADRVLKSAKKSGIDAVNILDIGYELNSDFTVGREIDTYKARINAEKYLKRLSGGMSVSVDKGSIFSLKYADTIRNIPTSSSEYSIFDASVPFFALVVRGRIPIVTESINTADNNQEMFLKTAEIGAELQYSWIYKKNENIIDYNEDYYNRSYTDTIEEAKNYSERIAELQRAVGDSTIVSHSEVSDDLICTAYQNGTRVLVNYSESSKEYMGSEVPAREFIILK